MNLKMGGGGEGSRYQVLKCTIHVLPPPPPLQRKWSGGGGGGGREREVLTPRNILAYMPLSICDVYSYQDGKE